MRYAENSGVPFVDTFYVHTNVPQVWNRKEKKRIEENRRE